MEDKYHEEEKARMRTHIETRLKQKFGIYDSLIERDAEQAAEEFMHENYPEDYEVMDATKNWYIEFYQEIAADQLAENMGKHSQESLLANVGMLRQWLNEDRITDPKKMITNKDIEHFLLWGKTQ